MATRRTFLQRAALGGLALNTPALLGSLDDLLNSGGITPPPSPQPAPPPSSNDVGQILIDYSAGVPSARSVKAAGYRGVIRYMSDRRESWMHGKPMRAAEVADMKAHGLAIVSCYQFGKGTTSDWRAGFAGGVTHANKGIAFHTAAGGPSNVPIYAAIDDNPTSAEMNLVVDYIRGWESVIGKGRTGVYANYPTIDVLRSRGLGTYFWMHNWGSGGRVHPDAHIHQFEIDRLRVDGIGIDRNRILKASYGQW